MATEAKNDLQLLQESFEKFMKNHTETMKSSGGDKEKVNEIMKLQETLFNNMNECIDDVIPKEVPDSKIFDAEIEFIFKADDQTVLETFVQNPGLQHLAENIFLNLNFNALNNCTHVNEVWKKFLNDPMFWLKRFVLRGLSEKNKTDWIEAIQMTRDGRADPELEENILQYLIDYSSNERVTYFDVPCYLNNQKFLEKAPKIIKKFEEDKLKTYGSDTVDGDWTIFHDAVLHNQPELIQLLGPLTPVSWVETNNYTTLGMTPIYLAARDGKTELIKILAPLCPYDPNKEKFVSLSSDDDGITPIEEAIRNGHVEIVKLLAPLARNVDKILAGFNEAVQRGETECVKILAPFLKKDSITPVVFNPQNPNAPPIYLCGNCRREVQDNDQAILCESGCNFWFHRVCTGLQEFAFHQLTQEVYAEWVCDTCFKTKDVPLVKFKP